MAARPNKSGTLTFLVTDLVGSTEQLERLGDEAGTAITTATMTRLNEVATQHEGEVAKNMGDGIMVAFASALDAVSCAVSMQRALANGQFAIDAREQLPVRIGLHAGEPLRVQSEYLGMPVNVAFRISHAAFPGQILVSGLVRDLVGTRGGFIFHDLGERALPGLRASVRIWEVAWEQSTEATARDVVPTLPPTAAAPPRAPAPEREPDTVVILFADVVDSMPQTARFGDAGFRERARELDGLLRAQIRSHRGTAVEGKLVGDGVLAIFPSARSAIACALRCVPLGESVELELHLGIHAGDVIREGNNVYGGAVNIASRISDATKAGEILVSDTVRGLARTSGAVTFEDRGEYDLKGIDEPMRLFTVRPDQRQSRSL
jgi:class 3 adenylate cyclase